MWGQPPRLSGGAQRARVERTLLSVAFDLDLDFDFLSSEPPKHPILAHSLRKRLP